VAGSTASGAADAINGTPSNANPHPPGLVVPWIRRQGIHLGLATAASTTMPAWQGGGFSRMLPIQRWIFDGFLPARIGWQAALRVPRTSAQVRCLSPLTVVYPVLTGRGGGRWLLGKSLGQAFTGLRQFSKVAERMKKNHVFPHKEKNLGFRFFHPQTAFFDGFCL